MTTQLNHSMERIRASRFGRREFVSLRRLVRTAHADSSATGDGFLINNYD